METTTTAREFTRNFRKLRAIAARGKTVRVTAPEGVYLFTREKSGKTCAIVLTNLARYKGKGFLTSVGVRRLETSKRRALPAKSPWEES